MNNALSDTTSTTFDQAVVASYSNHSEAETAVRRLAAGGLPINQVSIIGRNFETHEDIQGFYRPADAVLEGAKEGAFFGGFFGLMLGLFALPIVGGLLIAGPLAGFIAGALSGAGVGALVNGLVASGIPRDQALKYQERLQAGEFLVVLHGSKDETVRAHEILHSTMQTYLQTHTITPEDPTADPERE